ncbi:MAG: hypothetical protein R2783_07070 [Gelidibacter sp.]
MTIVEIIDYFDGFSTIKSFAENKRNQNTFGYFQFWYLLPVIIDNLTATIVLISILQK